MNDVTLHLGDCLTVMAAMEPNSVDTVITDPPYGLSDHKPEDVADCLRAWLNGEPYQPQKKGFMGKAWDAWVPGPEVWRECLRVLKPGGHMLVFAGTRSMDLMCMAIRLAGFELRDSIGYAHDGGGAPLCAWVTGQGFPKSHDISKAIDRRRTDEVRHICRYLRGQMEAQEKTSRDIAEVFGFHSRMVDHWAARDTDSQPSVPTWEQWLQLKSLLHFGDEMDGEVWRLNGRKGKPGDAWHEREVVGRNTNGAGKNDWFTTQGAYDITAPATEAAAAWHGWGTSLKPSFEPILLAMKPLDGTFAHNALTWGVAGLAIDKGRIGTESTIRTQNDGPTWSGKYNGGQRLNGSDAGRWPANVLFDEEAAAILDAMSGTLTSNSKPGMVRKQSSPFLAHANGMEVSAAYGDSGGASRFFYVAKASRAERNAGLEGLPERYLATMGDGIGKREHNPDEPNAWTKNHHPTVKPLALMRYLCRLTATPTGGTVLDPFMGSGSTGVACVLEGRSFVGIELEPDYLEIARRRIAHAQAQTAQPAQPALLEDA